jgi:hypothetical protein
MNVLHPAIPEDSGCVEGAGMELPRHGNLLPLSGSRDGPDQASVVWTRRRAM